MLLCYFSVSGVRLLLYFYYYPMCKSWVKPTTRCWNPSACTAASDQHQLTRTVTTPIISVESSSSPNETGAICDT